MNAAHHIDQAERMLHTGQISLAMLHMQRATEYLADARPPKSEWQIVIDVMKEAFRPALAAFRAAGEALARSLDQAQSDYALAGPSKGGTA